MSEISDSTASKSQFLNPHYLLSRVMQTRLRRSCIVANSVAFVGDSGDRDRCLRSTSISSADSEALLFLSHSLLMRSLSYLFLCDSVSGDWERGLGESVVPHCNSERGDQERCCGNSMIILS